MKEFIYKITLIVTTPFFMAYTYLSNSNTDKLLIGKPTSFEKEVEKNLQEEAKNVKKIPDKAYDLINLNHIELAKALAEIDKVNNIIQK